MKSHFSMQRLWAIIRKEFLLMKRDPATIVIMAILPLILVCIAGYAINTYPQKVPTVLINLDNTDVTRELVREIQNTGYFSFVASTNDSESAHHLLKTGKAILVLTIPVNFTKALRRNQNPALLLEDGSIDAIASGRAIIALAGLKSSFIEKMGQKGINIPLQRPDFQIINHRLYDPDRVTQFYVVPGMIGLVLMLTMLLITVVVAFRDVQGGTIEYLLASPTRPSEILLGEIFSYILIGYLQLSFGLILSYYLFHVPFIGAPLLLYLCTLPYIVAELSLGLTIATFCTSQFEAVQVINVFIAFSILLTGFTFPIFGMPEWAQYLGLFLPLTHFFKIMFGIMLKGNNFGEIWANLWPLLAYCLTMISLATWRFKRHFVR
ncbi:TPA: ABC transporter permease [Legionella pneumophila]|nr:ABC transporter permease [Legionella pneumophila]ERH42702.1 membrane protein [Legionella pneumophila str. Leg01/53]ERH45919.1 membrane protein [Legionella pneumophila str. Leg01/11]ERI47126.1 membrane protein [Legionella pneumophila str. Leg01/20]ERB41428.1 membrane protein [Legionella pneumophila str. 121004]MCW8391016.1 ABC transporter permease [Legionella pneumophila]